MSVYLQLFQNGELQSFNKVDSEMCKHFGVECDPVNWYENWYDTLGFSLALGHTWEQIRQDWPHKKDIIDWMENNYTPNSWSSK